MNGSASVYLWRSTWRMHPFYVRGPLSIGTLPVTGLAEDVDDLTLGRALRAALAASGRIRTKPSERNKEVLLKELGARSWRVLEREARHVLVSSTDGSIKITPMHAFANPVERESGWRSAPATLLPRTVADAGLGRAVRDGAAVSSQQTYERPADDLHDECEEGPGTDCPVDEYEEDPGTESSVDERELARLRFWSRVDLVLHCLFAVAVVAVLVMLGLLRF